MKNTFLLFICILSLSMISCTSKNKPASAEEIKSSHKVIVVEVVQANAYTYLLVAEDGREQWIAVSKMEAQFGETYYYNDFLEMVNFKSKDLDRIFESVYFIQTISKEPLITPKNAQVPANHMGQDKMKTTVRAEGIRLEVPEGAITIAELYEKPKAFEGEKISIKGKVVKANFAIMNKNWFHLQDGTSANGSYDLTITSIEEDVKVGDVFTFEGVIVLDKDFGSGYSYDVLMEEAVIIK